VSLLSSPRDSMKSRPMWVALGLLLVVLLIIGAHHPVAPTQAQRIANLEVAIKCPSCANASLAQSETVEANNLKASIKTWVRQGLSDRSIKARFVAEYGAGELLRPTNSLFWVIPVVAIATAVTVLTTVLLRRRTTSSAVEAGDEEMVDRLLRERIRQREVQR
jgi:cytochrome c-type biogenesis protein CcmH/NrfF